MACGRSRSERVEADLQWRAAFARHQPIDLEFRMRPIAGESVWSRALAAPSPAGDGFNGVIIDSTRGHLAEEEVRRLSERNAAIIASMPGMLFQCSREGRFLDFHGPSNSPLLMKPEAFLGKTIGDESAQRGSAVSPRPAFRVRSDAA